MGEVTTGTKRTVTIFEMSTELGLVFSGLHLRVLSLLLHTLLHSKLLLLLLLRHLPGLLTSVHRLLLLGLHLLVLLLIREHLYLFYFFSYNFLYYYNKLYILY